MSTKNASQVDMRPPLKPATSNNDRGRTARVSHASTAQGIDPTSWIRSASTSSLRKLRANNNNHSMPATPHHSYTTPASPPLLPTSESEILITKVHPKRLTNMTPIVYNDSMEKIWDPRDLLLIDQQDPTDDFSNSPTPNNEPSNDTMENSLDEDVVLDVLPSFEMYNALHRHIPQGNMDPDVHELPPNYGEASTQNETQPSPSTFTSRISTPTSSSSVASMDNTINNLRPLQTQFLSLNTSDTSQHRISSSRYRDNGTEIEDDLDVNDSIVIDKLYTLPKLSTPIDINIKITKHVSLPPHKPEEESILKEYTSGDTIHGYCVIENKSNDPIKFEMFYVTLEAYTSVIDKKKGTRTVKRFLRMVDLSASWSYTNIDLGSGFRYKSRAKDFDGAILGLNSNRILEPGVKYKKFFVFKFPNQLLDTTCKQEHFAHCLLPPSFGIDKYRNNCKYSGIRVNNILGCGHLGTKGSPILSYDGCDDELSINYTIDTRIVGKDIKTKKLNIMKEHEYNIRFIPFGFHSSLIGERNPASQLKDLQVLIEERLNVLKNIFQRLKKDEPIKNIDIHGTDLVGTIDDNTDLDSNDLLMRKLNQLHTKNRLEYSNHTQSPYKDIKNFERKDNIIESELRYRTKGKSSSKIGLFSGFLASSLSSSLSSPVTSPEESDKELSLKPTKSKSSDKTGLILVGATIPTDALPYHSPSLLRKTNTYENKSKHAQDNWNKLTTLLTEPEKQKLNKLKINLTCLQSNNSIEHEPPEIQLITTELISVTAKSENSIPIKLNAQLLLDSTKLNSMKKKFQGYMSQIKTDYERFKKNKSKLNELYNVNRVSTNQDQTLNFTNFIPNQLYSNIESLANLNVKIQAQNDIFKKQIEVSKSSKKHSVNEFNKPWVKKNSSHYEKELEIPLEYSPNLISTLVPSFESCLCCRFYCIRVNIKFQHIGSISIDVPVVVKNFTA